MPFQIVSITFHVFITLHKYFPYNFTIMYLLMECFVTFCLLL